MVAFNQKAQMQHTFQDKIPTTSKLTLGILTNIENDDKAQIHPN